MPNADFEGLTLLGDGSLLLAAERQPRGLIQVGPPRTLEAVQAWSIPNSEFPLQPGRPPDFSDLTLLDGQPYALFRNAHLIVQLSRTEQGWQERPAWSYAQTENDPRFAYLDTTFGMAEGLAVGEHEVYVVIDNNLQGRRADPEDRRPLLFVFERPPNL